MRVTCDKLKTNYLRMKRFIAVIFLSFYSLLLSADNNPHINYIDSLLNVARRISSQNIIEAETILIEAHSKSVEHHYLTGEAEAYRLFGLLKFFIVDYTAALELFIKSRDLFDKDNNHKGKARAINNIAVLYNYQGLQEKSLEIYNEVLEIYSAINDSIGIAGVYNNIAGIYKQEDVFDKALEYYKMAVLLQLNNNSVDNKSELSRVYNNIGITFLEMQIPDSAIFYLEKSLNIRKEIDEIQGIKNSLMAIGNYYEFIGDLQKARSLYEESLKIAKEIGITYEIESSAKFLFPVYKKLGMYKAAYDALLLYNDIKESYNTTSTIKLITSLELEARFEKEQQLQRLILEEKEMKQRQLMEKQIRIRNTLIISVLVLALIVYLIFRGYKTKQKHVKLLNEQKLEILEKNEELNMSQTEILAQRNEIEKQNYILENVNMELKQSNKKIVDSINYAQTIQKTILPYDYELKSFCNDYFILYKPCEIVSGDYYWYNKVGDIDVFAVADCTGHGVAGALMTMITNGILKKVIVEEKCSSPADALYNIHNEIVMSLKQNEDNYHNHDGMDIAIIYVDNKIRKFTYAGASIPLYVFRNNNFEKIDCDKGSIGGTQRKQRSLFSNTELRIEDNTKIWFVTDGYLDQMSPAGKKIGRSNFEQMLEKTQSMTMSEQKEYFEQIWINHKLDENQIDDMTLIGLDLKSS